MKQREPTIGIATLSACFGHTAQAFYLNRQQRSRMQERTQHETTVVLDLLHAIRQRLPRLGGRKLLHMIGDELTRRCIPIGRDRFFTLLRMHGLLSHRSRAFVVRTTNSQHPYKRYVNLILGMKPDRPNQLWVADITYILVSGHFLYLSLITDAYSHKIVGYAIANTLDKAGPLQALRQALKGRETTAEGTLEPLIHHSDRGCQYCSYEYTDLLKASKIKISMGEVGNPYENAIAERINGILKYEFEMTRGFESDAIATRSIDQAIETYNQLRPHLSCNYLTPDQAHQTKGVLLKRWKPSTYKSNLKPIKEF